MGSIAITSFSGSVPNHGRRREKLTRVLVVIDQALGNNASCNPCSERAEWAPQHHRRAKAQAWDRGFQHQPSQAFTRAALLEY